MLTFYRSVHTTVNFFLLFCNTFLTFLFQSEPDSDTGPWCICCCGFILSVGVVGCQLFVLFFVFFFCGVCLVVGWLLVLCVSGFWFTVRVSGLPCVRVVVCYRACGCVLLGWLFYVIMGGGWVVCLYFCVQERVREV